MHTFIENTVKVNAFNAAVTTRNARAWFYAELATDRERKALRECARDWLVELGRRYVANEYDLDRYCGELSALKQYIEGAHAGTLNNGQIAIGACQKMIGVYLKHLWLMGDIDKKPAAPPLDRQVILRAQVPGAPNWTEIGSMDEYRKVLQHVNVYVGTQTQFACPVVWEAETWRPEEAGI